MWALEEGFFCDPTPITVYDFHAILQNCGDIDVTVKRVRRTLEKLVAKGKLDSDFMFCKKRNCTVMHYFGKDWGGARSLMEAIPMSLQYPSLNERKDRPVNRSEILRIARMWVAGEEPSEEGRRIAQELLDAEMSRVYHSDEITRLAAAIGMLGETSTDVVSYAIRLIKANRR